MLGVVEVLSPVLRAGAWLLCAVAEQFREEEGGPSCKDNKTLH